MQHFTKELNTELGHVIFTFNSIYTVGGMRYYISVNDKKHHGYFFKMEAMRGKWFIEDNNLPGWVIKIQDALSDTINEHT